MICLFAWVMTYKSRDVGNIVDRKRSSLYQFPLYDGSYLLPYIVHTFIFIASFSSRIFYPTKIRTSYIFRRNINTKNPDLNTTRI